MASKALEEARASMQRATALATATARGTALIEDTDPTGDPGVDAIRADVIQLLGRQLTPNEALNIAAGIAHDFRPPPLDPFPVDTEMLHPEESLRRQAAAKAAQVAKETPA